MTDSSIPADLLPVIKFHGHLCPGLLMGYRATKAAMDRLAAGRSTDEEFVVIIENKACGVDAVQFMSGATFGKGNLVFMDNGKHAYTFIRRGDGVGLRVLINIPALDREPDREAKQLLLTAPDEEILIFKEPRHGLPPEAVIEKSLACDACGEYSMESRTSVVDGFRRCADCAGDEAEDR